jgi:chromosome segregation ATPase
MTDTNNTQALQKTQATPLEQARIYMFEHLRMLERNAKPKGVAAQVRIAIDEYVRQSEQTRRDLVDELEASRHHAKGLKSHNDELLEYRGVLSDAYDNQRTLTRNALVESRRLSDELWQVRGQLEQVKQLAGDQPAAQDIIDRLRSYITRLEATAYANENTIAAQADQLLAKDQRIAEIIIDVKNAEGYSEQLSKTRDELTADLGRQCTITYGLVQQRNALTLEVERQKEAVQRLLELNGELREAAGIAGDHVRAHNDDVGVLYQTLRDAQAQLTEYLAGSTGERETLGRLLGILDNGIIYDAMHGELRHYAATQASDA